LAMLISREPPSAEELVLMSNSQAGSGVSVPNSSFQATSLESLRESQQRLADYEAIAHVGNWSLELATGKATWSDEIYPMLGLDPSVPPSFELFQSLVHPDDKSIVQRELEKLVTGVSEAFDADIRIVRTDGQTRWLGCRGRATHDANGQVVRIEGTNLDVTERRQAAELHRAHSEVLMSMAEGVCFIDGSGIIRVTNPALDQMFGYEAGELVGQHATVFNDATPEENERIVAMLMGAVGKAGMWTGEFRNRKKDGTVFFTRARITTVEQGGEIQWVSVQEDITERKKIEAEHEELLTRLKHTAEEATRSRAELEAVIQSLEDGVFVFDTEGNAVLINQAAAQTDNSDTSDNLQNLEWYLQRYEVADLSGQVLAFEQWPISRILRGETLRNWELLVRRKDIEREVIVAFSGGPVFDSQGKEVLATVVARDITEQKQTENALRMLSVDLARLRGHGFYEGVVQRLAAFVNCDWAFICRRDAGIPNQSQTVAFWADGKIVPNFSYSMGGTPCENVLDQKSCIVPNEAWQRYPRDQFLIDQKVEAYVGVPFIDARGRQIGHIGVMSRRPLANAEMVERLAKLFALSVVAEMERAASERRFFDLFDFSPDAIIITNAAGEIVQANRQVAEVFGWTPEELVGQPAEVLMPNYLREEH
jgi:PAS domain S-box-containing protein